MPPGLHRRRLWSVRCPASAAAGAQPLPIAALRSTSRTAAGGDHCVARIRPAIASSSPRDVGVLGCPKDGRTPSPTWRGDHVQVEVEHLLSGRCAVGDEEVDPFAVRVGLPDRAAPHRAGQPRARRHPSARHMHGVPTARRGIPGSAVVGFGTCRGLSLRATARFPRVGRGATVMSCRRRNVGAERDGRGTLGRKNLSRSRRSWRAERALRPPQTSAHVRAGRREVLQCQFSAYSCRNPNSRACAYSHFHQASL